MALNIRDRTNRIRGMLHGGFHAQDIHLHKFHAQFREHNHHHALASKHDRLDVDQNHPHHNQSGDPRDTDHQQVE